ncbi:MAG: hypothetical protein [Olavius algarvensis Gamma 3 endosymbiont]|nr:MAG: hypothetical protein [Olavius algarvensis Gamma 3 endosymbiont]
MDEIAAVVPVLPVALMSECLLAGKRDWLSELELKSLAVERIAQLQAQGAPIKISTSAAKACSRPR